MKRSSVPQLARITALRPLLAAGAAAQVASDSASRKHSIFFERERQRISEPSFVENERIAGAQLKYAWRELEPERERTACANYKASGRSWGS